MFEFASKKKIIVALAPVAMLAGLSGPLHADEGFVTNASGKGVVNSYGECWNAVGGMDGVQPCVPEVKKVVDGDADGDGVPDSLDSCPNTPKGAAVDANGCPKDSDGDGVPDYKDNCPGTPAGAKVDSQGCEIVANVTIRTTADHFAFDSARLKPAMQSELSSIANRINASEGNETVEIIGHTDSVGTEVYNQGLSERRAQAVADYLAGLGVTRVTVKGLGESQPVADNSTEQGRAMNRRVEIITN